MKKICLFFLLAAIIAPVSVSASESIRRSSERLKHRHHTESSNDITEILNDEWIITSVGKTEIVSEENYPYIIFDPNENQFYASNGCNVLNGTYTVRDNSVSFHNVLSTMKYCADTPWDGEINAVLADDRTVTVKHHVTDGVETIDFVNSKGTRLMTLRQPGLNRLNGQWLVKEIDNEKFDEENEMTIFFDITERRVHGNTGCNSFNGEIYVDPTRAHSLSLTNMAVTMRMCPNLDNQRKFLVALEETSSVKFHKNNTVMLLSPDGRTVMKLERVNIE